MSDKPWHYTVSNLADLWEYLELTARTPTDFYAFLCNPQNWEAEWAEMLRGEEADAA